MINRRKTLALAAISLTTSLAVGSALAENSSWPTRPITIVMPYPAGGQTDAVARMLARELEPLLGQPVVVDNRPGVNGLIGTNLVARAAPDGYTLLLHMTALTSNPILLPHINYDPHKDFVPIARLYEIAAIWAVPGTGPKTVAEFISKVKADKKPVSFATTGHASSSHYFGEIFANSGKFELNHIPYKGEAPLLPDLVSGRLDAAVISSASALTYGKDGRVLNLAVSGTRRWKALPDVPTFLELGISGMTTGSYSGVFAPAKTPKAIVEKLNTAIYKVTAKPEFQKQLLNLGLEAAQPLTPEEFSAVMRKSTDEWIDIKKNSTIQTQ